MNWLDRPENVRWLYRGLWAVGIGLLAADLLVHRHAEAGFDGWFGYYGVYGFVACVVLVLVAKLLRRGVSRSEEYYDR